MSETKISREEAQAEIDGLLVAEILRDFASNFQGVYPDDVLAQGVGPNQSMIGLAIKRGHLATAARIADLERQLAEARDKALEEAAVVGGDAAVEVLLRQEPDASPIKVQLTRQAAAKAIRNLKGTP